MPVRSSANRILMKSTPRGNFINVLHTAFALVDPETVKSTVKSSVFFTLLGSTSTKAVGRTLMKWTAGYYSQSLSSGFNIKACTPLVSTCPNYYFIKGELDF